MQPLPALSFFKTTLRLHGIMEGYPLPVNCNILEFENVNFGAGYAISSNFVTQDYDGVIGLGRGALVVQFFISIRIISHP